MDKLISVIMSVYNEVPEYLDTAINSILNQTYGNFEFIILNDGSNDDIVKKLEHAAEKDNRIKLIHNEEQMGLTKSLNKGLNIAKGDFIARMDSDDFSVPTRFEHQLAFFEKHADIDIIGTGVVSFGAKNIFMSPCNGMENDEIRAELFFTSGLCHPSVMIRKAFLDKNNLTYDGNVKKGQDYDMWERCSKFGKLAVMDEVLLFYRIHDKQITSQFKSEQVTTAEMVMRRRLSRIGLTPTDAEYEAHLTLKGVSNKSSIADVETWGKKIIEANNNAEIVDKRVFKDNINKRIALVRIKNKKLKIGDIKHLIAQFKLKSTLKTKLQKANTLFQQFVTIDTYNFDYFSEEKPL